MHDDGPSFLVWTKENHGTCVPEFNILYESKDPVTTKHIKVEETQEDVILHPMEAKICDETIMCHTGINILTLDWVYNKDTSENDSFLAIGGLPWSDPMFNDYKVSNKSQEWTKNCVFDKFEAYKNAIQLWKVSSVDNEYQSSPYYFIEHNSGIVWNVNWCPTSLRNSSAGKIGWLAACFGDGTLQIYDVPLYEELDQTETGPLVRNVKPFYVISWNNVGMHCMDWRPTLPLSIAAGSTNGSVFVYDLENLQDNLNDEKNTVFPKMILLDINNASLGDNAGWTTIRDVKWHPTNSNILVTCGQDQSLRLWDINETSCCIRSYALTKISLGYSLIWSGERVCYISGEESIRSLNLVNDRFERIFSQENNPNTHIWSICKDHDASVAAGGPGFMLAMEKAPDTKTKKKRLRTYKILHLSREDSNESKKFTIRLCLDFERLDDAEGGKTDQVSSKFTDYRTDFHAVSWSPNHFMTSPDDAYVAGGSFMGIVLLRRLKPSRITAKPPRPNGSKPLGRPRKYPVCENEPKRPKGPRGRPKGAKGKKKKGAKKLKKKAEPCLESQPMESPNKTTMPSVPKKRKKAEPCLDSQSMESPNKTTIPWEPKKRKCKKAESGVYSESMENPDTVTESETPRREPIFKQPTEMPRRRSTRKKPMNPKNQESYGSIIRFLRPRSKSQEQDEDIKLENVTDEDVKEQVACVDEMFL